MPKIIIMEFDPTETGFMSNAGNTFNWGGTPRTFGVTLAAGWPHGVTEYVVEQGAPPQNPTTTYAETDFGPVEPAPGPIILPPAEPLYQFINGNQPEALYYFQVTQTSINWWAVSDTGDIPQFIHVPPGTEVRLVRQDSDVIIQPGTFFRYASDPKQP